jgi:hypothetical protein
MKDEATTDATLGSFARRRALSTLMGLVEGMVCDGQLLDAEVAYLRQWLADHGDIASRWPGNIVAARIDQVLADGLIAPDERSELLRMLQALAGEQADDPTLRQSVVTGVFNESPRVFFEDRTFVLTGEFVFGPRSVCQRAIEMRGGRVVGSVSRRVDWVVVGAFGSQVWAGGSFGGKIQTAMEFRAQYGGPGLVREADWADALCAARLVVA